MDFQNMDKLSIAISVVLIILILIVCIKTWGPSFSSKGLPVQDQKSPQVSTEGFSLPLMDASEKFTLKPMDGAGPSNNIYNVVSWAPRSMLPEKFSGSLRNSDLGNEDSYEESTNHVAHMLRNGDVFIPSTYAPSKNRGKTVVNTSKLLF
jgi:hypothetical protein